MARHAPRKDGSYPSAAVAAHRLEDFSGGRVAGHEEVLDLVDEGIWEIAQGLDIVVFVRFGADSDQPRIIDSPTGSTSLSTKHHAEESCANQAAGKCGAIDEDEDIERVSIAGQR